MQVKHIAIIIKNTAIIIKNIFRVNNKYFFKNTSKLHTKFFIFVPRVTLVLLKALYKGTVCDSSKPFCDFK